jgi:hypothetical protein
MWTRPAAGDVETLPVVRWIVVSVLVHLLAFGLWEGARRVAASRPEAVPEWLKTALLPPKPPTPEELAARQEAIRRQQEPDVEIPLSFLEVDPAQAVAQPPKNAQFMSTANTLAGNPNPLVQDADKPRVEGKREDTQRVMDIVRAEPPKATPQPAPAPEPVAKPEKVVETPPAKPAPKVAEVVTPSKEPKVDRPKVEAQPEGGLKAGETQLAKVTPNPSVPRPQTARPAQPEAKPQPAEEEAAPRRKPIKRVAEARQQKGVIVGEKMKQDGGVRRFSMEASLDVKESPFANYDQQLIYAVQQRWYALLDEHHYALDRVGRVVLKFQLRADGTIADMTQVESQVGEIWSLLCESAILSQAPYARWPESMRRTVGRDSREITFTFHYSLN